MPEGCVMGRRRVLVRGIGSCRMTHRAMPGRVGGMVMSRVVMSRIAMTRLPGRAMEGLRLAGGCGVRHRVAPGRRVEEHRSRRSGMAQSHGDGREPLQRQGREQDPSEKDA